MRTAINRFAIATLLLGAAALASAAASYELNIPAQPLAKALQSFAQQSGLSLVHYSRLTAARLAPALEGAYTPDAALTKLLQDTGLEYAYVNESTIEIREATPPRDLTASEKSAVVGNETGGLRLAQLSSDASPDEAEAAASKEGPEDRQSTASSAGNPEGMKLEEIVVTAQKRKERLQDIPISISVLSGEDLDRSRVQGVSEALNRVAGVATLAAEQSGGTTIAVRGVSAGGPLFNGSSPVGYYVDSVPFGLVKSAIVPDANAYDLDRVEILKGPQGTLYGANSVNGVVRVLTRDADLEAFDFKMRSEASTTRGGGDGYRGDLALNVPLLEGKLAARAVAGYNHVGGWIDKPNNKEANDADLGNLRLKVNAQPAEALSMGVSLWRSRNDYGAPNTASVRDGRGFTGNEHIAEDFDACGLKLGYEFSAVSLSSMSSYLDYRSTSALGVLFTDYHSRIFSQEILANSNGAGPWVWSAGIFYRDARDPQLQDLLPAGSAFVAPLQWTDTSKSSAFFGQLTRKLFDNRLELTGGLRYFKDKVGQHEDVSFMESLAGDPTVPLLSTSKTFDAWTPRAAVSWHANARHMFYASYSQGFRSGFEQDVLTTAFFPGLPSVQPDKLHNYEIGAKGQVLDGRLNYEAAAYYLDWQDIQQKIDVLVFGDTYSSAIVNGESASGFGFDLALTARPAGGLELGVSLNVSDLTLDGDVVSGGVVMFDSGERLSNSPESTASLYADYVVRLGGSGFKGQFSASGNYIAKNTSRLLIGTDVRRAIGDDIPAARASFTLIAPRNWEATIFAENLSDVRRNVYANASVPALPYRTSPRRVGVQLEYRFR